MCLDIKYVEQTNLTSVLCHSYLQQIKSVTNKSYQFMSCIRKHISAVKSLTVIHEPITRKYYTCSKLPLYCSSARCGTSIISFLLTFFRWHNNAVRVRNLARPPLRYLLSRASFGNGSHGKAAIYEVNRRTRSRGRLSFIARFEINYLTSIQHSSTGTPPPNDLCL